MTIHTTRLLLRPLDLDDFDAYAAMYAEPDVMRYLSLTGSPLSRFAAWQGFAAHVGHWQLRGYGFFGAIERETGEFVGHVGAWRPEGWPDVEVGWVLRSACWGHGYATEAASAAIDYAFTELQCAKIVSLIHPDNEPSKRVAVRVGERFDGEIHLQHLPPDMKVLQFSLSRADWHRSRPGEHSTEPTLVRRMP